MGSQVQRGAAAVSQVVDASVGATKTCLPELYSAR